MTIVSGKVCVFNGYVELVCFIKTVLVTNTDKNLYKNDNLHVKSW